MEFRDVIRHCARDRAVLVSTHMLPEARLLCDSGGRDERGVVVYDGATTDFAGVDSTLDAVEDAFRRAVLGASRTPRPAPERDDDAPCSCCGGSCGACCRLPQTYAIAAAYLLISGIFFVNILISTEVADLASYYSNIANTLLVLVPVVAMRSFAEERRTGALDITLTWPMSRTGLVLGKFAANTLFVWVLASVVWLYFSLVGGMASIAGEPDGRRLHRAAAHGDGLLGPGPHGLGPGGVDHRRRLPRVRAAAVPVDPGLRPGLDRRRAALARRRPPTSRPSPGASSTATTSPTSWP